MTFTIEHGRRKLKITVEWAGTPPGDKQQQLEDELLRRYASASMSVLRNANRSTASGEIQQRIANGERLAGRYSRGGNHETE
jgi:hypothetical protein